MTRQTIHTDNAPKAIGPYSQAIKANGFVYTAGQIALDPATGQVVEGGIAAQTAQVFRNLSAVLQAAGTSLENAVKTTVYLNKMGDFQAMNEVYAKQFSANPPARTTVGNLELPRGALVEIEVVALVP